VALHVLRELAEQPVAFGVVVGLVGVEERAQRHLGVDVDEAALGERHLQVGTDRRPRGGLGGLLQHEVAVLAQTGQLDHALQLQLAPGAPHLRLAQRRDQSGGLPAQVLAGESHLAHLVAQVDRHRDPFLLHLGEPVVEPLQALAYRREQLVGGLLAGLRRLVQLAGLAFDRLGRERPELGEQLLAVGGDLLGTLHRGVALGDGPGGIGTGGREFGHRLGAFGARVGSVILRDRDGELDVRGIGARLRGLGAGRRGVGAGLCRVRRVLGLPGARLCAQHQPDRAATQDDAHHQPCQELHAHDLAGPH